MAVTPPLRLRGRLLGLGAGWPCPPSGSFAGEAAGGQLLPGDAGQGCEEQQGAGAAAGCSRKGRPHLLTHLQKVLGGVLMPTGPAQVRDAVAVIQYLLWLEQTVPQGQVDEFLGARHIDALRWSVPPHLGRGGEHRVPGTPPHISPSLPLLPSRAQQHSRGPSFESISASGLNAALAHYRFGVGGWGCRAGGGPGYQHLPPSPPQPIQHHPKEAVGG